MAKLNAVQIRHRQSEKYRATRKRYAQSEAGRATKERRKQYEQTEEGRAAARKLQERYRKSERGQRVRLAYRFKNYYGLTIERYQFLVAVQDNKCALCGKSGNDEHHGRLSVDHCHKANYVRGLLCKGCNVAIGIWEKLDHEKVKTYLDKKWVT